MKHPRFAAIAASVLVAASGERGAAAHPAGTTSINRYIGVSLEGPSREGPSREGPAPDAAAGGMRVHLSYLLDFAELPAYGEIEALDADHDGSVTPAEQQAYLARRLGPIVERWTVEVDGAKVSPRVTGSNLEVLPGDQALSTLRIAADVEADVPGARAAGTSIRVHVVDPVFADRSGWRQMAAEASPASTPDVAGSSGPAASAAPVLAYGDAPNDAPPRVDDRVFLFRVRSAASDAGPAAKRGIRGLVASLAVAIVLGGLGGSVCWSLGRRRARRSRDRRHSAPP